MQKFTPALDKGPLPLRPIRCDHASKGCNQDGAAQPPSSAEHAPACPPLPPAAAATCPLLLHVSPLCTPLVPSASTTHRDAALRTLLDALDAIRGRKALVLEAAFASPLGLVADALTLKEHGVEV